MHSSFDTYDGLTPVVDQSTRYARPSHLIPPKKKDKKWMLAMIQSMYHEYQNYGRYFLNRSTGHYKTNNDYAKGQQSNFQYSQHNDENQSHAQNDTALNHTNDNLNLQSKYVRILLNKLNDVQFSTTLTPVNPEAVDEQREFKQDLETLMQIRDVLGDRQEIQEFINQSGYEIPDHIDDMEMELNMAEPMQLSMEMELGLQWVNYLDDLPQKFNESDQDLVNNGLHAIHTQIDANGIPRRERISPEDLFIGFHNAEDFRDASEVGAFRKVTISDIAQENEYGELSYEQLKQIEEKYAGKYGNEYNAYYRDYYDNNYDNFRVLLLDVYFYSWDEECYVKRKNEHGNWKVEKKFFDYYRGEEKKFYKKYPGSKLYRTRLKNVYKATWVVGTDIIYNWGLLRNMERTTDDPNNTKLPIQVFAPHLKDGRVVSIVEEMRPIIDQANLMFKKMEEVINHARPPGVAFDVDSFAHAVKAMAGEGWTAEGLMDYAIKHNIIAYSGQNMSGVSSGARPVEELQGGLGADFQSYWNALNGYIQLLQEITGFSNVAAGSAGEYTGKKVAELSSETAEYSIQHLYRAKQKLYENVMQSTTNLLMDAVKEGRAQGLKKSFSDRSFQALKVSPKAAMYEYSVMIEFLPTAQDWQNVYAQVQQAQQRSLAEGGISSAEAMKAQEAQTIKHARQLLYQMQRKNIREARQYQMERDKQNRQLEMQQAQQSHKREVQLKQIEADNEAKLKDKELEVDLVRKEAQFKYDLELKRLEGLIQSDQIEETKSWDERIANIKAENNMDRLKSKTLQTESGPIQPDKSE